MLYNEIKSLNDSEWHQLLLKSVDDATLGGVKLPGFPSEDFQKIFVGSSGKEALAEAFGFYREVKRAAAAMGQSVTERSTLLDFGVGWGRMLRYFAKDMPEKQLSGVDINRFAVSECWKSRVPGSIYLIPKRGRLPFADGTFSHVISYSVFTHLTRAAAEHWLSEISRVSAPNAVFVFTVESPRFMQAAATGTRPDDRPVRMLPEQWRAQARDALAEMHRTGHAFLPTGGEQNAADFGDAVFSHSFMKENWSKFFQIEDYFDDSSRLQQAGVVARKPA